MDESPTLLPVASAADQQSAEAAVSSSSYQSPQPAFDPKLLQADAVEQIEAAILQTTTSPAERALQIHAIKSAYLKARYNIESNGTMQ